MRIPLYDLASLWRREAIGADYAGIAVLGCIASAHFLMPADVTVMAFLVAVPGILVVGRLTTQRVIVSGALTLLVALAIGASRWHARPVTVLTTVLGVVLITVVLGLLAAASERRQREVAELSAVAEALRMLVLRPVPHVIGPVRMAAAHFAASSQARVGGDMCAAESTRFGVRLLISDVSGRGLAAAKASMDVLSAFRELAHQEERLAMLAARLHGAIVRGKEPEGFATAILVGIDESEDTAEIVCCGHPPPLVIRKGEASLADLLPPAPPLGCLHLGGGRILVNKIPFRQGDCLVLYTNGIADAGGSPYPLVDRVAELACGEVGDMLEAIERDLLRHAGGSLDDDGALLLLRRERGPADPVLRLRTFGRRDPLTGKVNGE